MRLSSLLLLVVPVGLIVILTACPPGPEACDADDDCPAGEVCDMSTFFCVAGPADARTDDAGSADDGGPSGPSCQPHPDAGPACVDDSDCVIDALVCNGVERCVCGQCATVDLCPDDGDLPGCREGPQTEACVACDRDEHCEVGTCDLATFSCVVPDGGG